MKELSYHQVNINGEIVPADSAKISVFDHGFLFGDSIYEVTRTYDQKILFMDAHLDRLFNSAALIELPMIKFSKKSIELEVNKTLTALHKYNPKIMNAYIRIMLTRGVGEMGIDPDVISDPNLIIIAKEFRPFTDEWYEKGAAVIIAKTLRNHVNAVNPNIKSGNYLNNIFAYMEAKKANVYDAILLNEKGIVTEATTSNVWMIKDGVICTTPVSTGILSGITRNFLIDCIKKNQLPFEEREFSVSELKAASEVFFTSSLKELVPITRIDNVVISGGKMGAMTSQLRSLYQREIKVVLYNK